MKDSMPCKKNKIQIVTKAIASVIKAVAFIVKQQHGLHWDSDFCQNSIL
jgi:hypothetical protein